jgi:aryl-alcohol dehydrogenase-like predicted oxidoreductase
VLGSRICLDDLGRNLDEILYASESPSLVATVRRAHAVQPDGAPNEYSLWRRAPETNGIVKACDELGIGFVP